MERQMDTTRRHMSISVIVMLHQFLMRPRISMRGFVRPSVRRLVGWLVGNAFFSNSENEELGRKKAKRTHLLVDQTCLELFLT